MARRRDATCPSPEKAYLTGTNEKGHSSTSFLRWCRSRPPPPPPRALFSAVPERSCHRTFFDRQTSTADSSRKPDGRLKRYNLCLMRLTGTQSRLISLGMTGSFPTPASLSGIIPGDVKGFYSTGSRPMTRSWGNRSAICKPAGLRAIGLQDQGKRFFRLLPEDISCVSMEEIPMMPPKKTRR